MTLDQILAATKFTDLFAEGTRKELRKLLKTAHPDLHPNDTAKAEAAFAQVNIIWSLKGKPDNTTTTTVFETVDENTIITKKHEYKATLKRASNGVNTYKATYDNGAHGTTIHLATHPKISALLLEGTKHLKHIRANIPEQYTEFFPETQDVFQLVTDGKKNFGVVQPDTTNYYTLKEVMEDYPEGIPSKDIAWMYRRMLVAIGNTHDAGIAHGAPTSDAFLIKPETHQLILTNWQFSQELGQDMKMLTPAVKNHYKDSTATSKKQDLRIVSETAYNLLHKTAPKRFKGFLNGMKLYPTNDARSAMTEFDALLKELWGERKFHEFRMRRSS